jgi:hypothetical protein
VLRLEVQVLKAATPVEIDDAFAAQTYRRPSHGHTDHNFCGTGSNDNKLIFDLSGRADRSGSAKNVHVQKNALKCRRRET